MRLDRGIETAMGMDDDRWRRHANLWSVWTRLAAVAAAAIAIYARGAIGGWWTLGACALIVVWLWLNTRVFPPVEDDRRWESQAIFGEVLWLERADHDLPDHHLRWTRRIVTGSVIALVPMVYGLVVFDPWATAFGATGVIVGQLWFLDRLAWLYADATATGEGAAGSGS